MGEFLDHNNVNYRFPEILSSIEQAALPDSLKTVQFANFNIKVNSMKTVCRIRLKRRTIFWKNEVKEKKYIRVSKAKARNELRRL
jgi:hypothetical protein